MGKLIRFCIIPPSIISGCKGRQTSMFLFFFLKALFPTASIWIKESVIITCKPSQLIICLFGVMYVLHYFVTITHSWARFLHNTYTSGWTHTYMIIFHSNDKHACTLFQNRATSTYLSLKLQEGTQDFQQNCPIQRRKTFHKRFSMSFSELCSYVQFSHITKAISF